MAENADARELTQAVNNLTRVVTNLDELLRRDYPKRAEIERRFLSKVESRKLMAKMVVIAFLVVLSSYATTTMAYASCYIGAENPRWCELMPGFDKRLDRFDDLNRRNDQLGERVSKLEEKVKAG